MCNEFKPVMESDFYAEETLVRIFITCILSSFITFIFNYLFDKLKGMMRMAIKFLADVITKVFEKVVEAALLA